MARRADGRAARARERLIGMIRTAHRARLRSAAAMIAALLALAAVAALGSRLQLNPSTVGFAFLIVVLGASLAGGLLVGTIASIVATLCYNYFFFPPLHTFVIQDPSNWVALSAFLVTSVTVNRLLVAARQQTEQAERRRAELETLYALSIDLFTATNRVGALGEAAGRALTLLGARHGGLVLFDGDANRQEVIWWSGEKPDGIEDRISGVVGREEPFDVVSPLGLDVYLPLVVVGKTIGALVACGTAASRQALESASRLVALAVERERFIEENAHLQAVRESEALKTSLLRAISHDLTTPLTAITIHTEALKRKAVADAQLQEPVNGIAGETARLRRRIDNLLAMARLEAGRAKPRPEPTPPADLLRAVRENLPLVFAARPVRVHVDDDCPDVNVDPSLTLEILVNLIENAHRVSPPGAPLELLVRRHPLDPLQVRIEVLDRGPGLPAGVADRDGNLVAGTTSDVAQRGLGLEIARGLAAANGGTIGITPRPGGGTVARVDLPAAPLPSAAIIGA
jgi:two-component system sensor histidine kinase KdpD